MRQAAARLSSVFVRFPIVAASLALSLLLSPHVAANPEELIDPFDSGPQRFYLVDDGGAYDGDRLTIRLPDYRLARDGDESEGRVYRYGDLLLLWNRRQRSYHLIGITTVGEGRWRTCWGRDPDRVRVCDDGTDVVHVFDSERAAAASAAGPDASPEPSPELQPAPQPEPSSEPQPAPSPELQPAPQPEPSSEPQPAPSPEPQPEPAPVLDASSVPCGASRAELREAIVALTNRSRAAARRCGTESYPAVGALRWNDTLASVARGHSNDMASNDFHSHTGSDGLAPWDRAAAAGYAYRTIGENIAAGYRTTGDVHDGWLESPGHCRNIMGASYAEIGAACATNPDSRYGRYWTVVFGTRR